MSLILQVVAPRMLGPAFMVAFAMVAKSYADVGDGFSAGVIVALAVGLRYLTLGPERTERSLPILRHAPVAAACGLLIALVAGFFPVAFGQPPFTHQPPPGEPVVTIGTLELITAVAFDVGLFLLVTGALVTVIHQISWLVDEGDRS